MTNFDKMVDGQIEDAMDKKHELRALQAFGHADKFDALNLAISLANPEVKKEVERDSDECEYCGRTLEEGETASCGRCEYEIGQANGEG